MTSVAQPIYDTKTIKRFWAKVDKNGPVPSHMPHLGQCWVWTGSLFRASYGSFYANGRNRYAHRVAWELCHGNIPSSNEHHGTMCILHHCDNPACVRESHLFIGTMGDNHVDMVAKGRRRVAQGAANGAHTCPESIIHGEVHKCAKLSEADVRRILSLLSDGVRQVDIASTFSVRQSTISAIKTGVNWKRTTCRIG